MARFKPDSGSGRAGGLEAPTIEGGHLTTPLDTVLAHQDYILLLRYVGRELMSVTRHPVLGAAELEAVIEERQTVKARVLHSVNAQAFADASPPIDLPGAITRFGYDRLRDLAIAAAVGELYRPDRKVGLYRRWQLWRHAVWVGVCARLLARLRQLPAAEWAFAAGFLHDIGILLEDLCVPGRFEVLMRSLNTDKTLIGNERIWLGTHHTEIGRRVADACEFHPAVRDAIYFHHNSDKYDGTHGGIVRCVEAANVICTMRGVPSTGVRLAALPRVAFSELKLTGPETRALAIDTEREAGRFESLLEI